VVFVVVPVVSLVPRSTTGYKLESLRDEERKLCEIGEASLDFP
jgi:hypothetical protein